jgi:integrase
MSAPEVWSLVAKRAPRSRQVLIEGLRKFLSLLDNPHAKVLSGRISLEACNEETAQSLEAWIVGTLRENKASKLQVADWLRLIFDAIKIFSLHGTDLFPTRLVHADRPITSPFSLQALAGQRRVDPWRQALYGWIACDKSEKLPEEWLGAIVISAAVHGALLDAAKLDQLIAKLLRHEAPSYVAGACYVSFHMPFQGLGNHHLQRWFIDPITEMLVWQYLKMAEKPIDWKLSRLVSGFLELRIRKNACPKNLSDFLSSAMTWWSQRAAPIDLHCASRGLVSHAINERSWARLQHISYSSGPVRKAAESSSEKEVLEEFASNDVLLLNPWLTEALQALSLHDEAVIESTVSSLVHTYRSDTRAGVYLKWLQAMLRGSSSTKEALALSTIRRRFYATAPRLVGLLGDTDPSDAAMKTPELEDYYAELVTDQDPTTPVKTIAEGIRDFHAFMHSEYKKPLMHREADVLGDENSLKPVDANVLSFDEYWKAQAWLDGQRAKKLETQACKIVLMLAFKLGMRRMEIFGMLRRDIDSSRWPTCLVRKNVRRRLKTDNSQRAIPLTAFLRTSELHILRDWALALDENHPFPAGHAGEPDAFFPEFRGPNAQAWVDKITLQVCEAVRAVTGDASLFMHHLRHSFGTWTYLRLRAPDFPNIANHFAESPATVFALKTGVRLRVLLYGRNPGPSRSYAFAVARLLGHSSPNVSFAHYVHSSDLILGGVTRRECERVPRSVLLAASGLQKSASYEHLNDSIGTLLAASRKMYAPTSVIKPDPQKSKRARGRQPLPEAHERSEWISLEKVRQVLFLSVMEKATTKHISRELEIDEQKIDSILGKAAESGRAIGLKCDSSGSLTEVPLPVRELKGIEFCEMLEARLAQMAIRAPVLAGQGVELYLSHFDRDKHDVVFKGVKQLPEANRLLRFFESLDVCEANFTWVTRVVDTSKMNLPGWAERLNTKWQPANRKAIKPKSIGGAASYEKWLGILPVDGNLRSLGSAVAKTMFLANCGGQVIADKSIGC